MKEITGTYIVDKPQSSVRLKRQDDNSTEWLDFFQFESILIGHFFIEVVKKIEEYIGEGKKVIIDFDKEKAMLIKDKTPNFLKLFTSEMSLKTVENYYEEIGNFDNTNYSKTILGENKDAESIC